MTRRDRLEFMVRSIVVGVLLAEFADGWFPIYGLAIWVGSWFIVRDAVRSFRDRASMENQPKEQQ